MAHRVSGVRQPRRVTVRTIPACLSRARSRYASRSSSALCARRSVRPWHAGDCATHLCNTQILDFTGVNLWCRTDPFCDKTGCIELSCPMFSDRTGCMGCPLAEPLEVFEHYQLSVPSHSTHDAPRIHHEPAREPYVVHHAPLQTSATIAKERRRAV